MTTWDMIDWLLREEAHGEVACGHCGREVDVGGCHLANNPQDSTEAIVSCWACVSAARERAPQEETNQ